MPTVLTIPRIERMKAAKDFQELWRFTTNDEGYELRSLYREVTDRDLGSFFDHATDDDWKQIGELISALERIVGLINGELRLLQGEDKSMLDVVEKKIRETADLSLTIFDHVLLTTLLRWLRHKFDLDWGHYLVQVSISREIILSDQNFDAFISYRTRNYLSQARKLANQLVAQGINVWFDEFEIGNLRGTAVTKNELVAILENAVRKSACSIIFESSMSAAALPPGITEEDALKDQSMMVGPNEIAISWDWQVIEIMKTSRGLGVHGNRIIVFDHSNPSINKWIDLRPGQELVDGIMEGLRILGVH